MRHHRKLLRRLRALFPREERRGVIVERVRGGEWRVIAGAIHVQRGWFGGTTLVQRERRCDALRHVLRHIARETRT